ncbi:MAG: 30S ribosomal protein S20 [Acidobacteriota bacterium]
MATHRSAEKKMKQDFKRRERRHTNLSSLRTRIKKLRSFIDKKDVQSAQKLLPETLSFIDRSVVKGIIHRNTASRYKSNLMALLQSLAAGKKG